MTKEATNTKTQDDRPEDFDLLKDEDKSFLLDWINDNLIRGYRFNNMVDSGQMKHWVQHETGKYYTKGEFNGAMKQLGFDHKPIKKYSPHWTFKIDRNSPALKNRQYIVNGLICYR